MLGYLLRNRKVWGLTIGFAAYGYSFYLFLTWLPNYLVETMHMSILKSAGYTAIPWIFATVADLVVGGWLIDHLIGRGHDETLVRKTVLVLGMLLGLAVFGATFTTSPVWAVVWISDRVERPGRGRAGGLVDPVADCAAWRDRAPSAVS